MQGKGLDIRCFQAYYHPTQLAALDRDFLPLSTEGRSDAELREFALYRDLFLSGEHKRADYFGLMSHKFRSKCALTGADVLAFIGNNPGYDVYLFNPYPQNAYYSYNIWSQGEVFHPGLICLADELFEAAGLPLRASSAPRMGADVLLYCNFWVGREAFCEEFAAILNRIHAALKKMPEARRRRFFDKAEYIVADCGYFPFIIERLVSTWLAETPGIKSMAYRYSAEDELRRCLNPFEVQLVRSMRDQVTAWDALGEWSDERRQWLDVTCRLDKTYYDFFYKVNPFPL